MSDSGNIYLWKERSQIDYIPLFMSLWFSLNAWMRDNFTAQNRDRYMLESMKQGGNKLSEKFSDLIHSTDSNGNKFRADFAELHRAVENAHIPYDKNPDKTIGFGNCILNWNNGDPTFESILKTKGQKKKIKIGDNLWIDDNDTRLFSAYVEIVYQVRCSLFHGKLPPKEENERVIKQLYLTLSMIMEHV